MGKAPNKDIWIKGIDLDSLLDLLKFDSFFKKNRFKENKLYQEIDYRAHESKLPKTLKFKAIKGNLETNKINAATLNSIIAFIVFQDEKMEDQFISDNKINPPYSLPSFRKKNLQDIINYLFFQNLEIEGGTKEDFFESTKDAIEITTEKSNEWEQLTLTSDWRIREKKKTSRVRNKLQIRKLFILLLIVFFAMSVFYTFNQCYIKESILSEKIIYNKKQRHTVIVLPFFEECQQNGQSSDVGGVIAKRLIQLNEDDSLGLIVKYFKGFEEKPNWVSSDYKNLMNKENASHIIYGNRRDAKCTDHRNKDKYCVRWISRKASINSGNYTIESNNRYKLINASLDDIEEGGLQKGVDRILYWNSMVLSFNKKDYKNCIKYADILTKNHNWESESFFRLKGLAYQMSGKLSEALKNYDRAIELNSNFYNAYSNRGNVQCELGNYDLALEDYNTAIEINPNYIGALNNRGLLYIDLKAYCKGLIDFNMALKIDSSEYTTYNNRGVLLEKIGHYTLALNDYSKAIEISPNEKTPYFNRAELYWNYFNDINKAIKDYKTILKVDKLDIYANFNLAVIYDLTISLNDSKALEYYNKAIQLDDKFSDAYFGRGQILFAQNKINQALKDYNRSIQLEPDDSEVHFYKGSILILQGDIENAIIEYSIAIDLDSSYIYAYEKRAEAYEMINKHELASNDLEKAKYLDSIDNYINVIDEIIVLLDSNITCTQVLN